MFGLAFFQKMSTYFLEKYQIRYFYWYEYLLFKIILDKHPCNFTEIIVPIFWDSWYNTPMYVIWMLEHLLPV